MVDRQQMFSGTETPPAHLRLDEARLSKFLRQNLPLPAGPLEIQKFKGGQSNPTYRITAGEKSLVLRRRPPGQLIKSAHAIDREFRVITALHSLGLKTPRPYLYVEDEAIIGSAFYLVENVPGRVFWDAHMPGVSPADRTATYEEMNIFLTTLHAIDPVKAGLGDLSRGGNYVARNLERWVGIYQQSELVDIPEVAEVVAALRDHMPPESGAVMLHGDYGLYNIILEPGAPAIAAVLDWEMATSGDALVDLAHHLRAWWDIPDAGGSASSLAGMDLDALGIPSMDHYIDAYFARRGLIRPDNFAYYLAFAQFRYAAMIQGILKRASTGTASSRTILHRQDRVAEIVKLALRTLDNG